MNKINNGGKKWKNGFRGLIFFFRSMYDVYCFDDTPYRKWLSEFSQYWKNDKINSGLNWIDFVNKYVDVN